MRDNTTTIADGGKLYESRIHELADEYVYNLSEGDTQTADQERQAAIKRTPIFKGMLKYIYNNLFKITNRDKRINHKSSNIDYSDIDLLNNIWEIYTGLCYKYCQNPTLLNFSLFTGIDVTTIDSWRREECRGYLYFDSKGNGIKDLAAWKLNHQGEEYRREPSSSHSQSVKKWLKECESAAYDLAMSGNPGGMFILKANYGYSETPQQVQLLGPGGAPKTTEQIAAEMGLKALPSGQSETPEPDF